MRNEEIQSKRYKKRTRMNEKKNRKKVPEYWWDIEGSDIIVESDDDRFPVCAKFHFSEADGRPATGKEKRVFGSSIVGEACGAVEKAEAYIQKLAEGRANPRIIHEE